MTFIADNEERLVRLVDRIEKDLREVRIIIKTINNDSKYLDYKDLIKLLSLNDEVKGLRFVDDIYFDTRASNVLAGNGVIRYGDLLHKSEVDLYLMCNFSKKSMKKLQSRLNTLLVIEGA